MKRPKAPPSAKPITPETTVLPGQDSISFCICETGLLALFIHRIASQPKNMRLPVQFSPFTRAGTIHLRRILRRENQTFAFFPALSLIQVASRNSNPTKHKIRNIATYTLHGSLRLLIRRIAALISAALLCPHRSVHRVYRRPSVAVVGKVLGVK